MSVWDHEQGVWAGNKAAEADMPIPDPLWVFGYGSLTWKTEFPFCEVFDGYIQGWNRRFWQGSTDHRGTPEAPGLVVTCITNEELRELGEPVPTEPRLHGRCYRVATDDVAAVLDNLDFREKGGYTRAVVEVCRVGAEPVSALLYTANTANPGFIGPAPIDEIASQLKSSHGPSGPNVDYATALIAYMHTVKDYSEEEDQKGEQLFVCLLYTSDAADEEDSVDLGGSRLIKKKNTIRCIKSRYRKKVGTSKGNRT
eukprot:TRINITY_DN34400_c0_g1_i2.p1 TRINITY_DN34400_c0_g1~~TRINITY_DN34400_c0_g1_i2.p1  ORF type:complete len:255 (-),score=45.55 TRINITY_DN34400_c0_g1_i2:45-809(-)